MCVAVEMETSSCASKRSTDELRTYDSSVMQRVPCLSWPVVGSEMSMHHSAMCGAVPNHLIELFVVL